MRKFVNSPTRQTLAELRQLLPNLVQALDPPRPSTADAERVRTRSTGVAAVDRLPDKDLVLARQLSDRLHINELLAARLVATQARTSVQTLVFSCARTPLTPLRACGPAWGRAALGCRATACCRRCLRRGASPHASAAQTAHAEALPLPCLGVSRLASIKLARCTSCSGAAWLPRLSRMMWTSKRWTRFSRCVLFVGLVDRRS